MTAVAQPSGTVTLVFTDIEGSTRLLEELGTDGTGTRSPSTAGSCARHAPAREGYEVGYEGDAFFYAFASAQAAVAAVSDAMAGLDGGPIKIRVGIHTGEPRSTHPTTSASTSTTPPGIMSSRPRRPGRAVPHHGRQLLEPGGSRSAISAMHRLKDLSSSRSHCPARLARRHSHR